MFTGIVEEIGTIEQIVKGRHSAVLTILAQKVLDGTKVGDSIAVNGICLTVTAIHPHFFTADVMHETLNRSALFRLARGSHVNLERAMPADGRFGGHIVAGHVDGIGTVKKIQRDDNAVWYTVCAEPAIMRYIVEKGSVAVDGVSLTVAKAAQTYFCVSAIPHTVERTVLKERKEGDLLNLETDVIGKYVERLLRFDAAGPQGQTGALTREFLAENGFS